MRSALSIVVLGSLVLVDLASAEMGFSRIVIDSIFTGLSRPERALAADLTGDNAPDLVLTVTDVPGSDDGVFWYWNDGNEAFSEAILDTTRDDLRGMDIGDLDGDLDRDVVLCAGVEGALCYWNDGVGGFSRTTIDETLRSLQTPVIVDFDGDSDADIVVSNSLGLFCEVNDGSHGFARDTILVAPMANRGLRVVDLDSDLDNDIVTSLEDLTWDRLVWVRNGGDMSFEVDTIDVVGQTISDIAVDDLDADGDFDIITTELESNSVFWYRNDGSARFIRETIENSFPRAPVSISVGDIDCDEDSDVIVTGGNNAIGAVAYYENDGAETFTRRVIDDSGGNYRQHASLDADDDGDLDLFVPITFPFELVYYRNDGPVDAIGPTGGMPRALTLVWNSPNPFTTRTRIQSSSSYASHPGGDVLVRILDMGGHTIRDLTGVWQNDGSCSVEWDGRDDRGRVASSGIYLARLHGEGSGGVGRLVLQR